MTTSRLRSLAGLGLASTVLLTGCGASGWNAGVAVRVDDESISLSEVQDTASSYCSAVETQLEEGTAVANSVVSSQVAGSLALRAAAEQWAAGVGVEPGEDYDAAADQLDQALAALDEDQQQAVRDVNLAQPYLDSVELAYGSEQVDGDDEAALAAGQEAFAAWLDDQEVRVDPRYSVTLEDGGFSRVDTHVSYAVSETAKAGSSGEPDADYANGLAPTSAVAADASGAPLLEFLEVMRRLRVECAWKADQTHRSLARYLLEETHETLEAIDTGDADHLREELGDLLLQVYFHAVIAEEAGEFTIDDVAAEITAKMYRRNPHVFAPDADSPTDAADIDAAWQRIKAEEKQRTSVTDGLPPGLPALLYADKVLGRLETAEVEPAEIPPDGGIGDRLLALVAEARLQGLDPEQELRDAVRRASGDADDVDVDGLGDR